MADAPERGFPVAEFEARTAKAQRMMAEAGFDALLLCTEAEVRYFSGFLTPFWQSPTRPWFLIVPRAGKPVAVIPGIGEALMRSTWIEDVRIWSAPHPTDDGVSLLTNALREMSAQRIGLPMGPESTLRMPLGDFERLEDLSFTDATPLIRACRQIKSEAEIGKIAHICTVASRAFARLPGIVAEGMPLVEAFRAFRIALLEEGADEVPYLVGGAGPGGYGDVISPPSTRPLARGDVLMFDTGSTFDGYFCDFDRNVAIGDTDDAAKSAYRTLYTATEAGLAAAKPGATCADLFHAMQGVIEAAGGQGGDVGRLGHGLGMQLTEWPSHTAWDETVLEPGMVLTLEPGMAIGPGRAMVHEENIVIREDGAHLLSTRAAPELTLAAFRGKTL